MRSIKHPAILVNIPERKSVNVMSSSTICILIAIVAYLGMMLYLGFRYSKASKSSDEFYLGR